MFQFAPTFCALDFNDWLVYTTVCLEHVFSFRNFFIRRFYPGTWVLIFERPRQDGVQYRNSVGEREESL
jgi:hypothetical protein